MIKARVAENNKICLVFDTVQAKAWKEQNRISQEGITSLLKVFSAEGIPFTDISAVCLSDVTLKPKATDFKEKKSYIDDLFSTYAFNVVVPVGAEAFNRIVGFKGQQKYLKKSLVSEAYPGMKVIPLQNPLQAKYDPTITDTIRETVAIIKDECKFSQLTVVDKMPVHYTILDSISKWRKFAEFYKSPAVSVVAYDTETKTFNYLTGELLTVQWSHKPGYSYLLPCRFYKAWTDDEWLEIRSDIIAIHSDLDKTLVGHNKKYDDLWMLHQMGVPLRKVNNFCTQIASFCCNENEVNDLKTNAIRITDMGDYEFEQERFIDAYCSNKANKIKKSEFTYDLIPFSILSIYALQDSDATLRLYYHYKKELVKEEQVDVFAMMMKFQYFFSVCESNGWPIDVDYCRRYLEGWDDEDGHHEGLNERIANAEADLLASKFVQTAWNIKRNNELVRVNAKRVKKLSHLINDIDFKLNSTPNKLSLFFDVMKLKDLKKTKSGGKSTDKEVIDQWIVNYPMHAEFLIKFREYGNLSKIRSTYVMAFINQTVEGRIHCTYSLTSAKTGRSACKKPNLQNIPAHSAEAKKVKRCFAAKDGNVILGADLQACEMRGCAVYSKDVKLIEIFNNKQDIHGSIAKDLFSYIECDVNEVKSLYKFERNEVSKRVQFGALYGMGFGALTRNINASLISQLKDGKITAAQFKELKYTDEMSKEVLSDYFEKYYGVEKFVAETSAFVEAKGYSLSLLGRKRRVPAVRSDDKGIKGTAIRQAVNAVIQSYASDALLLSAYAFQMEIEERNLPITILGSIHDALYIETPFEFKQEAADIMLKHLRLMPTPTDIPMEAEAEWGQSWADFSEDFGIAIVDEEDIEDEEEEEAA